MKNQDVIFFVGKYHILWYHYEYEMFLFQIRETILTIQLIYTFQCMRLWLSKYVMSTIYLLLFLPCNYKTFIMHHKIPLACLPPRTQYRIENFKGSYYFSGENHWLWRKLCTPMFTFLNMLLMTFNISIALSLAQSQTFFRSHAFVFILPTSKSLSYLIEKLSL